MNANILALLSLALFPLYALVLFKSFRPAVASGIALFSAEMFLPPGYCLPISPSWLSKWTLPPFTVGILAYIYARPQFRRSRPFRGIEAVFAIGILANFMTFWTNRDPLAYGPTYLPGENFKDLSGDLVRSIADPWVIFFVGRVLFKTSRDLASLCRMMTVAVLVLTLGILFEIRMSPCLNRLVYGYQAANFDMTFRWGGYRPTVFFHDGLPLASFTLSCVIMALASAKAGIKVGRLPMKWVSLYLVFIIVICKSTGVIVYSALIFPLVLFLPPKRTLLVASIMTIIFVAYPFLRLSNLIPIEKVADAFTGVSADRAGSLLYRFEMEQGMFELTKERPLWGWGSWGRSFVYDPVNGAKISIGDGAVILTVSSHGLVGFASYFLPFAYTVLRAPKLIKRIRSKRDKLLLSALAVNCAVILLDLVVNSAFFPSYMLLYGALYALPRGIVAEESAAAAQAAAEQEAAHYGLSAAPVYR